MQRQGARTVSLRTADRCDLVAKLKPGYHDISVQLHAIDNPNTSRRDDAIGWIRASGGYYVYTAITDTSTHADVDTSRLPGRFSMRAQRKGRSLRESNVNEAVTLSYWTDGQAVHNPLLRFGLVRTKEWTYNNLDDQLREELLEATQAPHTHLAINDLMVTYNSVLARTCAQRGISIPFYSHENGRKHYSAEPMIHPRVGHVYTLSTRPLARRIDQINNYQIGRLLSGRGPMHDHQTITHVCAYMQHEFDRSLEHEAA